MNVAICYVHLRQYLASEKAFAPGPVPLMFYGSHKRLLLVSILRDFDISINIGLVQRLREKLIPAF